MIYSNKCLQFDRFSFAKIRWYIFIPLLLIGSPVYAQVHWVGSWAAAQQLVEPQNSISTREMQDATLRQIVHLSIGGGAIRIHLSNAFGIAPLHLTDVHVAHPSSTTDSNIDPATDRVVMFGGRKDVTIPAGAEFWSDPVPFTAPPLSDLAISIHYLDPPVAETGHPGSRATSYLVHGNAVADPALQNPHKIDHWYQISGVDVAAASQSIAVVALGDSLTDGHGTTTNGNDRWTDVLARRLHSTAATANVGVLNAGIGGNRVLLDQLGPNALSRFDRDVLGRPGASFLIVLEGVNDLGMLTRDGEVLQAQHHKIVKDLIRAYCQIIQRAHAHAIFVIGGTIPPYGNSDYYHPGPLSEKDRLALNAWIRTSATFDSVVDFDKVLADPRHPDQLLPAYDSGDHLHPSLAGYRAMAEAMPIAEFTRPVQLEQRH